MKLAEMRQFVTCLRALQHGCDRSCSSNSVWQQLRVRSTVAAVDDSKERNAKMQSNSEEWQRARPFAEMPSMSIFQMVRDFMPGGKYHKLGMDELVWALKRDYGEILLKPKVFGMPAMVLTHNPEDFERIFRNEGVWPIRPGSETVDYFRSKHRADFFQGIEGLIATKGEKWGTFRTAVNPVLMQPKNVQLYLQRMSEVNKEFVERIKEIRDPKTFEAPDTFEDEINYWTLESVSVVALDKQLGIIKGQRNDPKMKTLFDSMNTFFELAADLEMKPSLWKYVNTPKRKRLMNAFDSITDITWSYINEAIERLERERAAGLTKADAEQSVLEKLLKLDKKIATVMAMDMLMAGVDTTTSTFVALLLCLAKNPEKQAKLREEVLRVLPHKNSDFSEDALNNMPYMRACLKESMRIYPLITGNAREPQNDVVLSGYRVPRGTPVSMMTATLMADPKHYPRANEYLPERWLRSGKEQAQTLRPSNPFIFLPFGFGSRSCIGKRIVEMELLLGISRIVRNFQVDFNYPTNNVFKSLLISVPNVPLKFKFSDIQ